MPAHAGVQLHVLCTPEHQKRVPCYVTLHLFLSESLTESGARQRANSLSVSLAPAALELQPFKVGFAYLNSGPRVCIPSVLTH